MKNKGFITVSLSIILLLSMPFASSILIKQQAANQIYQTVENIPPKEIGLVLGAAAYPSRLSDILQDRVDTAIELYQSEKVSVLIMSGAPNETSAMKRYAIQKGIPENAITEDPTGLNTMASIKNVSSLDRSLTIISQKYHLPRALFIARQFDINAIGLASDKREYEKMFNFKKRELLATSKTVWDLLFLN